MKHLGWALCLIGAAALGACQRAEAPKAAADPAADAAAAKWSALAKLPDWSGVWEIDWRNTRGSAPRPQMKLTPEYQARQDAFRKAQQKGENLQGDVANCVPPGLPGIMSQPYPIEFLFQPGKVVILTEAYMLFRQIHTDGRAHKEDPDLTFHGDSIGRWEGDTLVIDSVGFAEQNRLGPGLGHSDKLRIVERIRRVAPEWLEIETTLDDPAVFTEPYTSTTSYRHLDEDLREYVCLENNRDGADEKGRPSIKLE
jgi:hypothetical protein